MEDNFMLLTKMAEKLSYKPGHSFLVKRIDDQTAEVSLRCPSLPNANKPEEMTSEIVGLTINNTVILSTIISPIDALHAFTNVIVDFELHEAAENFKYNGRRVFLPHGWDNKSNEGGRFTWTDFGNLSGKFLRALKQFIGEI